MNSGQLIKIKTEHLLQNSIPYRFDLIVKLFFLEYKSHKIGINAYRQHIDVFTSGSFIEPNNASKCGIATFLDVWASLIVDLKNNVYNHQSSPLPISTDGRITNGAHRLSSMIYLRIDSTYAAVAGNQFESYGQSYFRLRGLSLDVMRQSMSILPKYIANIRVAVLWPAAANLKNNVIEQFSPVIYNTSFNLSRKCFELFVRHVYSGEEWLSNLSDPRRGSLFKSKSCYSLFAKTNLYVFLDNGFVEDKKASLRAVAKLGKHSIHITDTTEQAQSLLSIVSFLPDDSVLSIQEFSEVEKITPQIGPDHITCKDLRLRGFTELGSMRILSSLSQRCKNYYVKNLPGLISTLLINDHVYLTRIGLANVMLSAPMFFAKLTIDRKLAFSDRLELLNSVVVYFWQRFMNFNKISSWIIRYGRRYISRVQSLVFSSYLYKLLRTR